jgi:CheY-like chemotaxis protein
MMQPSNSKCVVLLVEDNPDHAELVARGLGDCRTGSDIRRVSDGEEALDYLFRRGRYTDPAASPRPQVILLDLRLPKIDGLRVLSEIKENPDLRRIPVLVLSTSDADKDVISAYDLHANGYLVKPLDFGRFHEVMESLGSYWLGCNLNPSS